MDREGMIDLVASNTGIRLEDTAAVINGLLDAIGDTLVEESVELDVFGDFTVEAEGSENVVKFKAGSELSGKVN